MLCTEVPTLENTNGVHTYPLIYVPAELCGAYRAADNWKEHSGQFVPIGAKTDYDVEVTASNTLSSLHVVIGEDNLQNVLSLKVKGTINSYDLMIMRNKMTNLKNLDLSEASIVACDYEYYTGYCSHDNMLERYAMKENLESLMLPNNIEVIGNYAFYGLNKISELDIPESVTSIGVHAFNGCSKLTSITIPESVTSIGESTFQNCSGLTNITIPESVTSIGVGAFSGCSGLTSITIPESVTSIGSNAFYNCSQFTNITIPNSVTSIGESAFNGCSSLQSMTLPFVGGSATYSTGLFGHIFGNNYYNGSTTIVQYYSSKSYYRYTVPYSLRNVTITGGNLPYGAFYNCTLLTSITLQEGVTSIGSSAFYNCSGLTNITIPKGVTSIGENAFSGCSKLTSITIPENVTSIGTYAFQNCSSLSSITIPESVTSIGTYAFYDCSKLESCILPKNSKITKIDNYTFSGCSSLKAMQLPVSVTQIGDYAFEKCAELAEMKIPSGINKVGTEAFKGCTSLNDVYTYTIEPQSIAQNTFATYGSATLHVPAVSYYNYYYNTQWSRFLKLVNFDEPYDYCFVEKDFTLQTDAIGTIKGNPEVDIWAGGGFIIDGETSQTASSCVLRCDAAKGIFGSIISRLHPNFKPQTLYVNIEVNKDFWYAFSFPFPVDLTKVKKDGDWVFRRYDGSMRAEDGSGGWRSVEGTTLAPNTGYIFRSNTAGTLSIPITSPDMTYSDFTHALKEYASGNPADAGWNFIGNPYTSYYSMNDMDYTAPVVVWNGTSYEAYRPGDDEHVFHPFEAFFVQCPKNYITKGIKTLANAAQSYLEVQEAPATSKARRAKAMALNQDRQLINLTLSNGTAEDKCRVVFNEKQKMEYEAECDAAKFLSSEAVPQIYTIDEDGNQYAINERPEGNGEVMLGFVANADGEYTLSASRMDAHVAIYDYELDEAHDFADGDYTFQASAGVNNSRFALVKVCDTDVTGIASLNSENSNAVVYDLSGRAVSNPAKGVYIVNGKKTYIK